jgi:hypothetical protein
MFGIRGEFDVPSPMDWLVGGFQTLPLPIFFVTAAATLYVVVTLAWRITTRLSMRTKNWSSAISTKVATAGAIAGLAEPKTAGAMILTLQVALLVGVSWGFRDLISALTTPLDEGPMQAHAGLAPGYEQGWFLFCAVSSILAFVSTVTWVWVARHRREEGAAAIGAGFALAAMFAAMATVPRQVINEADFRVASFESERCYVVKERQNEAILLLCPWRQDGRTFVVATKDPRLRLQVGEELENVFAAVAARLRPSGGS